ncbi:hypothetical protein SAMN02745132_03741 [Enterovibrio nigricans DSM 22720]|uniref:Uncharacterized protein n=1 Tax=Enterovibrio nigricans DSM 22720 TaxID=1121868 RepID=A0A1T4VEN6_9GAMM|nr:hypothetical protein SAMN02745132_03741 [Enterovibrio nigricans DSM 22720]
MRWDFAQSRKIYRIFAFLRMKGAKRLSTIERLSVMHRIVQMNI